MKQKIISYDSQYKLATYIDPAHIDRTNDRQTLLIEGRTFKNPLTNDMLTDTGWNMIEESHSTPDSANIWHNLPNIEKTPRSNMPFAELYLTPQQIDTIKLRLMEYIYRIQSVVNKFKEINTGKRGVSAETFLEEVSHLCGSSPAFTFVIKDDPTGSKKQAIKEEIIGYLDVLLEQNELPIGFHALLENNEAKLYLATETQLAGCQKEFENEQWWNEFISTALMVSLIIALVGTVAGSEYFLVTLADKLSDTIYARNEEGNETLTVDEMGKAHEQLHAEQAGNLTTFATLIAQAFCLYFASKIKHQSQHKKPITIAQASKNGGVDIASTPSKKELFSAQTETGKPAQTTISGYLPQAFLRYCVIDNFHIRNGQEEDPEKRSGAEEIASAVSDTHVGDIPTFTANLFFLERQEDSLDTVVGQVASKERDHGENEAPHRSLIFHTPNLPISDRVSKLAMIKIKDIITSNQGNKTIQVSDTGFMMMMHAALSKHGSHIDTGLLLDISNECVNHLLSQTDTTQTLDHTTVLAVLNKSMSPRINSRRLGSLADKIDGKETEPELFKNIVSSRVHSFERQGSESSGGSFRSRSLSTPSKKTTIRKPKNTDHFKQENIPDTIHGKLNTAQEIVTTPNLDTVDVSGTYLERLLTNGRTKSNTPKEFIGLMGYDETIHFAIGQIQQHVQDTVTFLKAVNTAKNSKGRINMTELNDLKFPAPPKGILLHGPWGTGKTQFNEAIKKYHNRYMKEMLKQANINPKNIVKTIEYSMTKYYITDATKKGILETSIQNLDSFFTANKTKVYSVGGTIALLTVIKIALEIDTIKKDVDLLNADWVLEAGGRLLNSFRNTASAAIAENDSLVSSFTNALAMKEIANVLLNAFFPLGLYQFVLFPLLKAVYPEGHSRLAETILKTIGESGDSEHENAKIEDKIALEDSLLKNNLGTWIHNNLDLLKNQDIISHLILILKNGYISRDARQLPVSIMLSASTNDSQITDRLSSVAKTERKDSRIPWNVSSEWEIRAWLKQFRQKKNLAPFSASLYAYVPNFLKEKGGQEGGQDYFLMNRQVPQAVLLAQSLAMQETIDPEALGRAESTAQEIMKLHSKVQEYEKERSKELDAKENNDGITICVDNTIRSKPAVEIKYNHFVRAWEILNGYR